MERWVDEYWEGTPVGLSTAVLCLSPLLRSHLSDNPTCKTS